MIRQSLQTSVCTAGQLKLNDFLKEHRENRHKVATPKFSEAVEWFKPKLEHDASLKESSKKYRLWCLGELQKTWPELWDLRLNEITPQAGKEWSASAGRNPAHFVVTLAAAHAPPAGVARFSSAWPSRCKMVASTFGTYICVSAGRRGAMAA